MSRKLGIAAGVVLVLLGITAWQALYTVDVREQAIVLQFGEFQESVQEPGLHVKIPFIQNVIFYERRVLSVDPPVEQVILADQRRLDVDAFIRYRIEDPRLFFQTVNDERIADQRLSTFLISGLRQQLGQVTQPDVLSEARAVIMGRIGEAVTRQARPLGIEIVDVRIGRADVPEQTVEAVYGRMRSEREREAQEYRAQGSEQAQETRSIADRERTVILAEAERDAQIIRGGGDAESIRVLAEAYTQDEDFFSLYRSLQAYRTAMNDDDTTMILSPEGDFFRYFESQLGIQPEFDARAAPPAAPTAAQASPPAAPPQLSAVPQVTAPE